MRDLATVARWETLIFLAGCFAILVWNVLRGGISLQQLLHGDRSDGTVYLSPGRILLLLVTALFSLRYLTLLIRNPHEFPQMSPWYLWALAGSQILYLLGKTHAIFFNQSIFIRSKGSRGNFETERRSS